MAKIWTAATLTALALVLSGCGGSNSAPTSVNTGGGTAAPQYTTTLPDGSPMDIEVVDEGSGRITGSFAVAAETGPYAFQAGSFEGSVTGSSVDLTCTNSDGTQFDMTGKQGSNGYQLTRSDIPGTVLDFTFEAASQKFRANTSMVSATAVLGSGGTSGRLTINTSPYSVQGTLTEYRGTWAGTPATFWQYSSGQSNLLLYIDPLIVDSGVFTGYRLTDFATATVSSAATLTTYSSVTKSTFRTRHTLTCSP